MKYKAVIFDLFGTLIENYPESEFQSMLLEVALIVSAGQERFVKLWNNYSNELMTGSQEVDRCIGLVCRQMGLALQGEQLNNAYEAMINRVRSKLEPPSDTLEVLSNLRDRGYRLGLISNCSNEVPLLWNESPLVAVVEKPVFSCSVGLQKPDQRIYILAADWLGVKPQECLFVDDNLGPLKGAEEAGMTGVLIQDIRLNKVLIDSDGWSGPEISSLSDIMGLLDR